MAELGCKSGLSASKARALHHSAPHTATKFVTSFNHRNNPGKEGAASGLFTDQETAIRDGYAAHSRSYSSKPVFYALLLLMGLNLILRNLSKLQELPIKPQKLTVIGTVK